jgi:hypothetical protein
MSRRTIYTGIRELEAMGDEDPDHPLLAIYYKAGYPKMGSIFKRCKKDDLHSLRLEFLRFHNFMENCRKILAILEDGEEKLIGEYIFDQSYISSLVDSCCECLAMLAFDACVLSPSSDAPIYEVHDKIKGFAVKYLYRKSGTGPLSALIDNHALNVQEWEYHLLAEVILWIKGPLPDELPSVTDFVRLSVNKAVQALRRTELILSRCQAMTLGNSKHPPLYVVNLGSDVRATTHYPIVDILRQTTTEDMTVPVLSNSSASVAIIDNYRLSLRGASEASTTVLELTLSGDSASDFLMIFTDHPNLINIMPSMEFRTLEMPSGLLGWVINNSHENLVDILGNMNQRLSALLHRGVG